MLKALKLIGFGIIAAAVLALAGSLVIANASEDGIGDIVRFVLD